MSKTADLVNAYAGKSSSKHAALVSQETHAHINSLARLVNDVRPEMFGATLAETDAMMDAVERFPPKSGRRRVHVREVVTENASIRTEAWVEDAVFHSLTTGKVK